MAAYDDENTTDSSLFSEMGKLKSVSLFSSRKWSGQKKEGYLGKGETTSCTLRYAWYVFQIHGRSMFQADIIAKVTSVRAGLM